MEVFDDEAGDFTGDRVVFQPGLHEAGEGFRFDHAEPGRGPTLHSTVFVENLFRVPADGIPDEGFTGDVATRGDELGEEVFGHLTGVVGETAPAGLARIAAEGTEAANFTDEPLHRVGVRAGLDREDIQDRRVSRGGGREERLEVDQLNFVIHGVTP